MMAGKMSGLASRVARTRAVLALLFMMRAFCCQAAAWSCVENFLSTPLGAIPAALHPGCSCYRGT
jgi:hypothetical protein